MAAVITAIPGIVSAEAAVELAERQKIVAEVKRRLSNKQELAKAVEAGRERITLCATCHGIDGNATKPENPNLAGQNPAYMFEQMDKFQDGRRKSFVMEALVKNLTDEDKINIAIYFGTQEPKPVAGANRELASLGAIKYKIVCAMCHGESGRGEAGFARLAGQQTGFVMMTLKRFRANAQRASDFDETKRTNARMEQVTQFLTDEEIESLAHYIALMK